MSTLARLIPGLLLAFWLVLPSTRADTLQPVKSITRVAQPVCADPAADIRLQLLSKTSATEGRVRITGVLRNAGSLPWVATSYSHRMRAVLAIKTSEITHDGQPVAYPRDITSLAPGAEEVVVYEMNYTARYNAQYPKLVMRFSESGTPDFSRTTREKLDCRTDNNRREISATDINRLFGTIPPPPPPLVIQSMTKGNGQIAVQLRFQREGTGSSQISATVEPPHTGSSSATTVQGSSGSTSLTVSVNCPAKPTGAEPVKFTFVISAYFGVGGHGSAWVPIGQATAQSTLDQICGVTASAPVKVIGGGTRPGPKP